MADADSPNAAVQNGTVAANKTEGEDGWFDRVLTVFGLRPTEGLRENLAQALANDTGEDSIFTAEERQLLQNILALKDVRILDVMVPRADIDAVAETISLSELIKTYRNAGHSRLPVYGETLDDPVGFVHAKDVMIRVAEDASAGDNGLNFGAVDLSRTLSDLDIVRPILFVPPSMPAMDLMVRMQAARVQLALVVDEYGGTDGLVSLEDLIETVVGDIEDEYDWPDEPTMTAAGEGTWYADARVAVDDFAQEAGVPFPQNTLEDVDTLGGIVFAILGRVPVRGELVSSESLPGYEFEVLDADPRRIKRVKVTYRPPRQEGEGEEPPNEA
ncbi:MAG: hemolysin family protein [Pseudomonadota bacterium]